MKIRLANLVILILLLCFACPGFRAVAAEEATRPYEYATLRWDGRENAHVIYPNGHVEFLAAKFKGIKKPERADERAFFMNLAVNALAQQGYELAAMTPDDYVFKRAAKS